MSLSPPSLATVLDVIDGLGPPGTPLTTAEVAEQFDCSDRTVYNRLTTLVEDGKLQTKKVGARGRVWWRPNGLGNGRSSHRKQEQHTQSELDAFRIELTDAIRPLSDPVEIQHEAARVVGEYLDVERAHYGEVLADGDTNVVRADYYREGVSSVVGEHRISDFGDILPEKFWDGETMAIDDISTMSGLSDDERAAYIDHEIRAWMNAPFIKNGELVGYFTVTQSTPRDWTETEVRLVEETADRTWAAVERARAEQALQESEERYRTLFEEMDEGFALNELVRNADGQVCDVRYSELNEAFEELTGVSRADAEGRLASEVFPGQEDEFFEMFDRVAETGESAQVENYVPSIDRWYDVRIFPREEDLVAVLYNDITDRKRLVADLRTEKEHLDLAVANSPLVLFRLDMALRYTWIKNPAEDFDAEGVLGKRDDELLPAETAEILMAPKRTALETGETVREELTYDLPSGEVTYDLTVAPLRDESGEIAGLTCVAFDITERKRLEEELRTEKEQLDVAVANAPIVLFRMDSDLRFTWAKNPSEGFEPTDLLGKREDEFLPPEVAELFIEPKLTAMNTGETVREELRYNLPQWSDREVSYDLTVAPLRDASGEITGVTCAALNITEQKRTQRSLERLNAATRELMDASPEAIARRVADLTRDVLGVEHAALWRYDETDGELREFDTANDPDRESDAIRLPDEFSERLWDTFIGTEIRVENDLQIPDSTAASPLRSAVLAPVGKYGVLCACSTGTEGIGSRAKDLIETLAATVEVAWTRAEGARRLEHQNEELARFDQLYGLVWRIDQALIQADTVDEIDNAVCERLADSDLYEFAWIGEYDATTDAVEPQAWAGVDSSYLDEVIAVTNETRSASDLFAATVQTKEPQAVPDIATDARTKAWREMTLERGARSCLSIPLVHEESVYGVLVVYKRTPQPDKYDRDVLAALGRTIAHAINAVETRETIYADSVVELTLQSATAETPLCRLSRTTDCVIEFEGVVPGSDGTMTVFFTATGVSPDEIIAAADQTVAIEGLSCLDERENGALFEARLSEPSFALLFLERHTTVRDLTVESGTATAVVDLPESADVREFIEEMQSVLPDLELLARRPRRESLETLLTLRTAFEERLTPRQREVLQLAYRSGFFESPRIRTGQELADALDISQSTFNYHLRGAERELCEAVFDPSSLA